MKEAVTKDIDTLIQEDFHGALQKLLERYPYEKSLETYLMILVCLPSLNQYIIDSQGFNISLFFR